MGSAYFVVTERELGGYCPEEIEGKMLSAADQRLDEGGFYDSQGLRALHHFCGDDMSDFLDDEDIDIDPTLVGEKWFDPAEGIEVVRAIIAHLEATPSAVERQEIVLGDLAVFESALSKCQEHGVKWHLSIDI